MRSPSVRRSSTLIGLGAVLVAVLGPTGSAQSPTSQPLVQAADMRYLGFFRVPSGDGSGASTGSLTYGGTALSLSPGGLMLGGHDWYQRLCEVSIPAIGSTAVIRQRCVDVLEGRQSQVDEDGIKLGGTLVYNGRLIVSAFSYYDADIDTTKSHFASGTTLSATGDLTGPVQVGTRGAGFVAGYMGVVPAEWRPLLGGPALTGACCLSIISRTSSGPAVSVFNPDDIGRATPVPSTHLLGYPLDRPLADPRIANTLYTHTDNVGGVAFPAGTRSVLFIGRHGTGQPCYGTPSECGNDPAQTYKGDHAYPYVHQVWAYDANQLLAVKNGTRRAWEVRPYAVWRLTEMNNTGGASIAGATFDPTTRRLYVTERYGDNPRVHVYEIGAGTAPLTTSEICGDQIDNDGDGQIDEGCPAPGTPPPPVPGPPTPSAEVCGDRVDNDGDAAIDEGCPGAPQRLTGDVKRSRVTLSWLAPIVGTVPAQYIVDAGTVPGQTAVSFQTMQTSTRVDNVGNGRYYVRVRAKNAAGVSVPSNEIVVSVGCTGTPNAVTNLVSKVRGALVTLTWTDPDGCTDTAYRVALADYSGGANIAAVATSANRVTGLAGPGTYYAHATTITGQGVSQPSAEVRFTVTTPTCVPPSFPIQLARSVTGNLVQLAWNPSNIGAALAADAVAPLGYMLEAGSAPGHANILRLPLGRTTYVATRAPAGTYYVRIRPMDVCGVGSASNEVIVRVP